MPFIKTGNINRMKIIYLVVFCMVAFAFRANAHEMIEMSVTQTTDSIIAPNVFTPNADGRNDEFEVVSSSGETVSLKIFTRAGALIFSIEAPRCIWDGKSQTGQNMAEGIYYYTAEVPGSSPKISKSGFVHLFR